MATMVRQPYVNHIPTMTGGVGHEQLKRFYAHHFIPVNPPDLSLIPVSRTVGRECVVDEFIVRFTHTTEIDWLLPGIAPTGRKVEVPAVAIVKFEGDKVWRTSISTGTRLRYLCRSGCLIRRVCRWPERRRLTRWLINLCQVIN
jgi:carboxymethylenebutenolidase